MKHVEAIVQRLQEGAAVSQEEVEALLSIREPRSLDMLFSAARNIKERNFGNKVFFYGFVYFSTHCRNNCSFCFYRRSNTESLRYRKTDEEILSLSTSLADSGVHLIDLTMGEDPILHRDDHYRRLLDIVNMVNDAVDTPLMLSPGALPADVFGPLRDAGADWFACYQETHNRELFERLRPEQDYEFRLSQKKWARKSGILAEEGIMVGVGETLSDRARSIMVMKELGVDQIRAMSFVPQHNTPMADRGPSPYLDELITIAVMRLVHPTKLIPATLDVEGIAGLAPRLDAGANVITSIIPPLKGLAGVAQHELDIDDGSRSMENVECVLDKLGVQKASRADYAELLTRWKGRGTPEA